MFFYIWCSLYYILSFTVWCLQHQVNLFNNFLVSVSVLINCWRLFRKTWNTVVKKMWNALVIVQICSIVFVISLHKNSVTCYGISFYDSVCEYYFIIYKYLILYEWNFCFILRKFLFVPWPHSLDVLSHLCVQFFTSLNTSVIDLNFDLPGRIECFTWK